MVSPPNKQPFGFLNQGLTLTFYCIRSYISYRVSSPDIKPKKKVVECGFTPPTGDDGPFGEMGSSRESWNPRTNRQASPTNASDWCLEIGAGAQNPRHVVPVGKVACYPAVMTNIPLDNGHLKWDLSIQHADFPQLCLITRGYAPWFIKLLTQKNIWMTWETGIIAHVHVDVWSLKPCPISNKISPTCHFLAGMTQQLLNLGEQLELGSCRTGAHNDSAIAEDLHLYLFVASLEGFLTLWW